MGLQILRRREAVLVDGWTLAHYRFTVEGGSVTGGGRWRPEGPTQRGFERAISPRARLARVHRALGPPPFFSFHA